MIDPIDMCSTSIKTDPLNVVTYPFSQVIKDVTRRFSKVKVSEYQEAGRFQIIDQGKKEIAGYTNDENLISKLCLPIIIFGDHTCIFKYLDKPFVLGADGTKALEGDLVFNRTNSKVLVGKTAVYDGDEPVIIAGYLIRVRFDERTNPWFVWGHLNSKYGKNHLFSLCRNIVGMANINAKELQSIPILKPPIDLQYSFAAIVEKVEGVKLRYQRSLSDLEILYGALSQKAFKGELDLSGIPFPAIGF